MVDTTRATDAHPSGGDPLGPLAAWEGTWRGRGHGDFPTIDAFDYLEEVVMAATGKPVLSYTQRTRHADDGRPLHAESGYLRRVEDPDPGRPGTVVEWVVAQATGLVETTSGRLVDGVLDLAVRPNGTQTAVEVTRVRRRMVVRDDELTGDLWMATRDVADLTHHLHATLRRG